MYPETIVTNKVGMKVRNFNIKYVGCVRDQLCIITFGISVISRNAGVYWL